jgi:ParB family transcriptional regulator, chromosome partitioning protein
MEKKNKTPVRNALGRGLSSLISTPVSAFPQPEIEQPRVQGNLAAKLEVVHEPAAEGEGIQFVPIDQVAHNPFQPRQTFAEAELKELADSIKWKGVLQPVLLRLKTTEGGGRFEIVAGERRWRAAKQAGLTKIPAIVRTLDDRETLELAIIENVQRENLSPIEEAQAYQKLAHEFSLSQQEIADKVGKDRTTVANFMRLLKLPVEIIEMLKKEELSMGHAKAILTIKEPSAQLSLARKVLKESLSVRDLETIVARVVVLDAGHRLPNKGTPAGGETPENTVEHFNAFPEVIDRMRNALGTKVVIKHHRSGRGRIEIEYFSEPELDRLVEQICR